MGRHWTVIGYLFHGSSLRIVPITAMLQGVLWLRSATEGFCSWPPKFSKCPTFFDLLFCLNNNFQTKKFDALRRSFDWKLISPIMSKDTLRNIFSFYMCTSQIFSYCSVSKDLRKFHKIALCSKSPHFDGATLNKFSCIYLTETHAQWNSCFHIRKRELWWFKFAILEPCIG